MAKLLLGKEVNQKLNEDIKKKVELLKEKGVEPMLAIVRIGENESDLSYERGATKRCETLGVKVEKHILQPMATKEQVLSVIDSLNKDKNVNGVLMFRPLPKHLDAYEIENALDPSKDVDCMTESSIGAVFTGRDIGYSPCTPQACMEILDYYGIDCTGKKAVVIGRSLVVGKPVAMMLMRKNATVTICHTKTNDMAKEAREADILVVAAGHSDTVNKDFVREGQIVLDVGINVNEEGKLCGDVKFEEVEGIVDVITPVPGGVGGVTTSVLVKHVVEAAAKQNNINFTIE